MRGRLVILTLMAALAVMVAAGCADEADREPPLDDDGAPWPGEGGETTPRDLGAGLVVGLPDGWEVTPLGSTEVGRDEEVCPQLFGSLSDGEELIELQLNGDACTNQEQEDIGNGHHGTYVRLEDVPEPLDVEEHDVPLGHLTMFSQDYYECTNECNDYQDNVALLEFSFRPDPIYGTLVLIDVKGGVPRESLVALAEHILPALPDSLTPYVESGD